MSYENSKLFTDKQKDMRMTVLAIIARLEAKKYPVGPLLIACAEFDVDFIEEYDAKTEKENQDAEIQTQLFWENIRSNVEQQHRIK